MTVGSTTRKTIALLFVTSQSRTIPISDVFKYEQYLVPDALFDEYELEMLWRYAQMETRLKYFRKNSLEPVDAELV